MHDHEEIFDNDTRLQKHLHPHCVRCVVETFFEAARIGDQFIVSNAISCSNYQVIVIAERALQAAHIAVIVEI